MTNRDQSAPPSGAALWAGRVLSGLVIAFLVLDGAIKLVPIQPVTDTLVQLGYSGDVSLARGLGVLTLLCAALYAFPRAAFLGAVLLTGLLGGAMATHFFAGRQPALQPPPVRLLPRPDGLGRALSQKPAAPHAASLRLVRAAPRARPPTV